MANEQAIRILNIANKIKINEQTNPPNNEHNVPTISRIL